MSQEKTNVESDLASRREQAIKEDKAYGVTRLREEFRMKPDPDAQPAFYSKSPYNNTQNPCYKVADCIPLREIRKREPTQREVLGRKISGIKAKLRSNEALASKQAADWLENPNLRSLDTETTGLGDKSQIIELALCDTKGETVYCQRFKPTVDIEPGAYNTHGISIDDLKNAPSWADCIGEIRALLEGNRLVIFNSEFDLRLIRQTNDAFGQSSDWVNDLIAFCAMYLAVDAYGSTNSYGTISLATAAEYAGVKWEGKAHSADADAMATMGVVTSIAEYYRVQTNLLRDLESQVSLLS